LINKKILILIHGVFLLFGIIFVLGAQSVEVREISIMKDRPDEIYYQAATKISLWISDNIGSFQFMDMDNSYLEIFEDDQGLDLITSHENAIDAWNKKVKNLAKNGRYVSMSRSHNLLSADGLDEDEGISGFYLNIDSWALPSSATRTLHISGVVSYVVALEEQLEETFFDFIVADNDIIKIDGYRVEFTNISGKNEMVEFTMDSQLPVINVEFYNSNGVSISEILYTLNGNPVIEIPKANFDSKVTLIVTYNKTMELNIKFNKIVGLRL